jgi:hypothetical protein
MPLPKVLRRGHLEGRYSQRPALTALKLYDNKIFARTDRNSDWR